MSFTVSFLNRDFSTGKLVPRVDFEVVRYSRRAMGGCYEAEIRVIGADLELWAMMDFLRCPVFIATTQGDFAWWGYVAQVGLTARNPYSTRENYTRVSTSLDAMFNKVAVAYETISLNGQGGARATTAYASDTYSQNVYGVKDGMFSGESASDATLAEQTRDILLAQKKYPIPAIELNAQGQSEAILTCRGWWDTMNWRQGYIPTELAMSYQPSTSIAQNYGTVAVENIAQGIVASGDLNMAQIAVYIRKQGAPADNLSLAIYDTVDGITPDSNLGSSAAVAGSGLTTSYAWTVFTFAPEIALVNGTTYFIVFERSGAPDDVNYYQAELDAGAGYAAATFCIYDGANWSNLAYDAPFKLYVNALIETSVQVVNLCTAFGQFFSKVESEIASGVTSESYRDGDGSALYEAEQLMAHGTSNIRRMLVTVDSSRRCLIYEEPENTPANLYKLFSDGTMQDNYGAMIRPEMTPAGVYARLVDVIPPSVDSTALGNVEIRFIEGIDYTVKGGAMQYLSRDELDPFTVGRPLDG